MNADALNGITVGGKPVAKYIAEKETDEKTKQAQADFDREKSRSKKGMENRPKVKMKNKNTCKSRSTTFLPRRQINREYWRRNMKASRNMAEMIISVLLTGQKHTAKEIYKIVYKEVGEVYKSFSPGDVSSYLTRMSRSELGALLIKENISATKRPVYKWQLAYGARDITLPELSDLFSSRSGTTLKTLKEKYNWIETWLKEIKWQGVKKHKVEKRKIALKKETGTTTVSKPAEPQEQQASDKPSADKLIDIISSVVGKAIEEHTGSRLKMDIGIKIRFGLLPEIIEYKNR